MKPSEIFKARVEDGRIILEIANQFVNEFRVVGCSEPMSVPDGSGTPCLVIIPNLEEGGMGVVVLHLPEKTDNKGRISYQGYAWPIRITMKGNKPWLGLGEELWACSPDRLGGVVDSHVEVNIDGQWYSSGSCYLVPKKHVPDASLICRYLVGKATKEDVLAAAHEVEEEQSAREQLPRVQDNLCLLQEHHRVLGAICKTLQDENNALKASLHALN